MLHLAWLITLSILTGLGTIGNIFIIGAVCLSKQLRVRGHAFIINLALADLVITSYIIPMGLVTSQYDINPFGKTICDINAFLILTSCGVSTQSLMLIALERYFHICKTHHYSKVFKKWLVALFIILTWLYTAAWTSQGWTGWTRYLYGVDIWVCLFEGPYSLSYDICLVIFGTVLPMLVLGFSYFQIFLVVRKSKSAIRKHRRAGQTLMDAQRATKREVRFVLTLFIIVVVFCIMWTPASVVLVMSAIWEDMPKLFYTISVWLAFYNSCMNAVIYGVLNKNFRRGYAKFLKYILFCRRKNDSCHCALLKKNESVSTSQSKLQSSPNSSETQNQNQVKANENNAVTHGSNYIATTETSHELDNHFNSNATHRQTTLGENVGDDASRPTLAVEINRLPPGVSITYVDCTGPTIIETRL